MLLRNTEPTPVHAHRAIEAFEKRGFTRPEIKEKIERLLGVITVREQRNPQYSQPRTKQMCELMLDRL